MSTKKGEVANYLSFLKCETKIKNLLYSRTFGKTLQLGPGLTAANAIRIKTIVGLKAANSINGTRADLAVNAAFIITGIFKRGLQLRGS